MDATTKKLLNLLGSDNFELRVAAAQVLAELAISTKPVIKALGNCLREPYEPMQLAALKGLARLGAADVSHLVVPMILKGGAIREHSMAVIVAIGPSAVPQLRDLYDQADQTSAQSRTAASHCLALPVQLRIQRHPNVTTMSP